MSAAPPLILLPPSEGKAVGGTGPAWSAGSMSFDLDERRERVIDALERTMRRSGPQRQRLLGVKGIALASATEADLAIRTAPTLPAIERYTGVLFDALDHRSLPATQRRRLNTGACIVSGLWGLVTPADPWRPPAA